MSRRATDASPIIQARRAAGAAGDALERDADRVADRVLASSTGKAAVKTAPLQRSGSTLAVYAESHAVGSIGRALSEPGAEMAPEVRSDMESRFGHDFSSVRIHSGSTAARSAREIEAQAYTASDHIVFDSGRYAPGSTSGRRLLAHELAHVVQQRSGAADTVQRQPAAPAPRADYVFIMGDTSDTFYLYADRYFRAHVPGATFVADKRSLADVLSYIADKANVADPIGRLYIVSHAHEDGSLGFALNGSDTDSSLDAVELREALKSKSAQLADVKRVIDAKTAIHIKGCSIGRSKEMLDFVDEAFGGAGTVDAPTHEQVYGVDDELANREETAFNAEVPTKFPMPPAVDPKLEGDARKKADADRAAAITKRDADIAAERSVRLEKARTVEKLSGPFFQRPGTKLFTTKELLPELKRLYSHLSDKRRAELAGLLVQPDRNPENDPRGQKVIKKTVDIPYIAPADAKEFLTQLPSVAAGFKPGKLEITSGTDGKRLYKLPNVGESKATVPSYEAEMDPLPSDSDLLTLAKLDVSDPSKFDWKVLPDTHDPKTATTTRHAEYSRVRAYLHHESLDAGAHTPFTPPESDRNFYAESTFSPPAPPASTP